MGLANAITAHDRIGTHGNAWNAAATGAAGNSNAIDLEGCSVVSIFGTVAGATTLTLWVSQNGTNYYKDDDFSIALGSALDFGVTRSHGARFLRLQSSNDVVVTATIAARG